MKKKVKTMKTSLARGTLLFIFCMLISSALVRISSSAVLAMADEQQESSLSTPTSAEEDWRVPSPRNDTELNAVIQILKKREDKIRKHEQIISLREKALEETAKKINQRILALKDVEDQLQKTIVQVQTASESDLQKLIAVYENMKPKDAAKIFQAMDANFAAGFLALMQPTISASIMSELDAELAYSISAVLAGRNARAAKQ